MPSKNNHQNNNNHNAAVSEQLKSLYEHKQQLLREYYKQLAIQQQLTGFNSLFGGIHSFGIANSSQTQLVELSGILRCK
jgi:hypothetical protein